MKRPIYLDERMSEVVLDVLGEHTSAVGKFGAFNSRHEGYAVLLEEVDELWDVIKRNQAPAVLRAEAVQVAAMAIRFILDCCPRGES